MMRLALAIGMAACVASGIAPSAAPPAVGVHGRVVFDGATLKAPADLTRLSVSILDPATRGELLKIEMGLVPRPADVPGRRAQVGAGGEFVFEDVPAGTFSVGATPVPGWWLRSAMAGSKDVLDSMLSLPQDAAGGTELVITYSDRHTSMTGIVRAPNGQIAASTVIVFPSDSTAWSADRRIRRAEVGPTGRYTLRDLPPGEYLAAVVDGSRPVPIAGAAYLASVAPRAVRFTLAEGDQKSLDLSAR